MKNSKFLFIGLLSFGLAFASCSSDDDDDKNAPPAAPDHALVGTWEAYDVSAVLAGVGITGVTAEFKGSNTYTVTAAADGANIILKGNYSISDEASDDGIYEITLNQTDPESLTSEGIFKIYEATPDSMWYEVAQTDPVQTGVTRPTVEGGFGSTSGGAFGMMNIQKYTRQ